MLTFERDVQEIWYSYEKGYIGWSTAMAMHDGAKRRWMRSFFVPHIPQPKGYS